MLRIVLLIVYLAPHLCGTPAISEKHGSGLDPLGVPASTATPPLPTTDHGSELGPLG